MKIEVIPGEPDEFTKDPTEWAYKDGKFFDVLESSKTYCAGSLMGRMRVVVEGDTILKWIYPLLGAGEYQLISSTEIAKRREMIESFDAQFDA